MGQERRKLRVAIEHAYTLDGIPVVKFVLLTRDRDLLPYKLGKPIREFFVDNLVEFL